jgi:hypothetical protein
MIMIMRKTRQVSACSRVKYVMGGDYGLAFKWWWCGGGWGWTWG